MSHYDALRERIAHAPTNTLAERAALLAAVAWVRDDGTLWPAVATWAQLAGLTPRGLQRALRSLEDKGLLLRTQEGGGSRKTTRYRIPLYATTPDRPSAIIEPRPPSPQTPTSTPTNPDGRAPEPRPTVRGTTKNIQENNHQHPAVADVLARLGLDALRTHPNATPERLAWIEREARTKKNPAGWAAACIRDAWAVPAATPEQQTDDKRAQRERILADFDAMPQPARAELIAMVRRQFPNLAHARSFPDDDPILRGAVAKALAQQQRTPQAPGDARMPTPALPPPTTPTLPTPHKAPTPPAPAPTQRTTPPDATTIGRVSAMRSQIRAEREQARGRLNEQARLVSERGDTGDGDDTPVSAWHRAGSATVATVANPTDTDGGRGEL